MTSSPTSLTRYAWLSIAAAISTILLKGVAWQLTGSVGLLSDAIESFVNLAGALMALWMLTLAAQPADAAHPHGHGKAEYFSSAFEGFLIVLAAISIGYAAILRLLEPQPLEAVGIGLVVSVVASIINFATAGVLMRVGKKHNSITLEADAHHLMTDVWTSVGVLVGIGVVALTGLYWLDPLIALGVGVNIVFTGVGLVRRSVVGLLDATLPPDEVQLIERALVPLTDDPRVHLTDLRTRESGRQRFVQATLTVPGEWTVRRGHDLADRVEDEIGRVLPGTVTFVHVEPAD